MIIFREKENNGFNYKRLVKFISKYQDPSCFGALVPLIVESSITNYHGTKLYPWENYKVAIVSLIAVLEQYEHKNLKAILFSFPDSNKLCKHKGKGNLNK